VGAVGGADLDQPGAGTAHDLRHPEGAADLDQFSPRHDRLAALGERVEHQQHRRRIVVDHRAVLRAGQLAQEIAQDIVAVAAPAGAKIVLERDGMAHRISSRRDCRLGHHGATQVGVQHSAGEIVDGLEARGVRRVEARQREGGGVVRCDREAVTAQLRKLQPHRTGDGLMSEARRRDLRRRAPHHRVDGGQAAPVLCLRIRHQDRLSPSLVAPA
jgi:hypothetical protein